MGKNEAYRHRCGFLSINAIQVSREIGEPLHEQPPVVVELERPTKRLLFLVAFTLASKTIIFKISSMDFLIFIIYMPN